MQSTGQKVGAAGAVCHIRKENHQYSLCMANVGDVEVVICRRGEVVPISRRFLVQSDHEECGRICRSDGIITEVHIRAQYTKNQKFKLILTCAVGLMINLNFLNVLNTVSILQFKQIQDIWTLDLSTGI